MAKKIYQKPPCPESSSESSLRHVHCAELADFFSIQWGWQEKSWPMREKEAGTEILTRFYLHIFRHVSVSREASKLLHFFSLQKAADKIKNYRRMYRKYWFVFWPSKGNFISWPVPLDITSQYQPAILAQNVPYKMKLCLEICKQWSPPTFFYIQHLCAVQT